MKNDELIDKAKWAIRNEFIQVSLVTEKLKEQLSARLISIVLAVISLILLIKLESSFLIYFSFAFISSLLGFSEFYKVRFYKLTEAEKILVKQFERFLKNNSLFIRDNQYITESVVVEFKLTTEKLVVRLISRGNRYTDKIAEMEAELQSVLNLELIDKRQTLTSTDYFFRLRSARRIDYERDCFNIMRSNKNSIAINSELEWNLTKAPHALVAGNTGGGKTYFLFHIIYLLMKIDADVFIADPKKSDLYSLKNSKAFKDSQIECEKNQICRILRVIREKMDERYEDMALSEQIGITYEEYNMKPLMLIFDELAAFVASCDKKQENEAMDNLRQVIFKGRQAGVFVIIATQKPEAEAIPTSIRDQLGLRVALGNLSADGYKMVFGKQEIEYYSCVPGEGYLFIDGETFSTPQRFQAPYIKNLQSIVQKMEMDYKIDMINE